MKVGCVLINYNDFDNLFNTYLQFKNMSCINNIIIVDNNSNDIQKEKLKSIINFEKLEIVFSDFNGGYGYANNIGINLLFKKYKCDYAIISNNDVIVKQKDIDGLFNSMLSYNASCVSALQMTRDNKIFEGTCWNIPSFYDEVFRLGFIARHFVKEKNTINLKENKIINCDCVSGSFLIVNINDFITVGGYDERIFLYHEETVLGIKFKKHKFKTICDTHYNYIHMHGISISKSMNLIKKFKTFLKSKEKLLFYHYKCNIIHKLLIKILFIIYLLEYRIKIFLRKDRLR